MTGSLKIVSRSALSPTSYSISGGCTMLRLCG
jgi:hypothetical protein